MLIIKNNIMAANAVRHLNTNYNQLGESVERISSGLRINSSDDDAAGMAVREIMRANIAMLKQGSRNAQDAISMLQTMEGGVAEIDAALIRMKELAEQAATGSYSEQQRTIMNNEFEQMIAEIDRIATTTQFNSIRMLDSATGSNVIHFGENSAITVNSVDVQTSALGVDSGTASIGGADGSNAQTALGLVNTAIERKDSARAMLGYMINRLESTNDVLNIESENLMAAESRISDADVAVEMSRLTRSQVLAQGAMSMLGQANVLPEMALPLLNG